MTVACYVRIHQLHETVLRGDLSTQRDLDSVSANRGGADKVTKRVRFSRWNSTWKYSDFNKTEIGNFIGSSKEGVQEIVFEIGH